MSSHNHLPDSSGPHRLGITILLNAIIFIVELAGGVLTNSLALISDAMHNLSDFFALILTYIASRLMLRKSSSARSYGYVRVEILVAFVNAITLVLIGMYIIYEGILRFLSPEPVASGWMLMIALIGLGANTIGALLLKRDAHKDLNMKSAYLHLFTDALESLGVVVVAILIAWWDWRILDPLISIAIGGFVIKGAWGIVSETVNILTEGTPQGIDLNEVATFMQTFPGIRNVHHVHIWSLSSQYRALSAHVVMEDQLISKGGKVTVLLERELEHRYKINHPTLQIESAPCPNQEIVVDINHKALNARENGSPILADSRV